MKAHTTTLLLSTLTALIIACGGSSGKPVEINGTNGENGSDGENGDNGNNHPSVPFEKILCPVISGHSDDDQPYEIVVDNGHDFLDLFLAAFPGIMEVPEIDFHKDMAIVLSMGVTPDTAHRVDIVDVVEDGDTLVVEYRKVYKPFGCIAGEAITWPYCVVTIDRTDKEIVFSGEDVHECLYGQLED